MIACSWRQLEHDSVAWPSDGKHGGNGVEQHSTRSQQRASKHHFPPFPPSSVPLPIPLRSNSHDVSPHPSSLTNTQQQPADISDERQPFTSSTLTMTGWSRLQPKTAYPTFPSHTQEPAKGPRGAAKTRGKEAQH
ncbi:hypothetical protein QJQ45_023907 [Haematococcus lacustris]|nr:hypothetical protein QJQ45_023907 [Haematococcus lacustris]